MRVRQMQKKIHNKNHFDTSARFQKAKEKNKIDTLSGCDQRRTHSRILVMPLI